MDSKYWIYIGKFSTPMYIRSFPNVLMALSGITENTEVSICCGYDVYQVGSRVMKLIADNYYRGVVTVVAYCGESYPLTDIEDILSFLRKTKAERFYVDGEIIRSLTNPLKGV